MMLAFLSPIFPSPSSSCHHHRLINRANTSILNLPGSTTSNTPAQHSPCVFPLLSWSLTWRLLTLFAGIADAILAASPKISLEISYPSPLFYTHLSTLLTPCAFPLLRFTINTASLRFDPLALASPTPSCCLAKYISRCSLLISPFHTHCGSTPAPSYYVGNCQILASLFCLPQRPDYSSIFHHSKLKLACCTVLTYYPLLYLHTFIQL